MNGLGGGFHIGVLCVVIYEVGREAKESIGWVERLGALIRDTISEGRGSYVIGTLIAGFCAETRHPRF